MTKTQRFMAMVCVIAISLALLYGLYVMYSGNWFQNAGFVSVIFVGVITMLIVWGLVTLIKVIFKH